MHEVEHALDGNLCRCTGYRPILQAFRAFSSEDASAKDFVNKACDTIFPEELKVEVPSAVTYKGDETIVRVFPAVLLLTRLCVVLFRQQSGVAQADEPLGDASAQGRPP